MQLDPEDEKILAGEQGETRQKMLELLVALGKVFGAERLVPIKSAQVSGASTRPSASSASSGSPASMQKRLSPPS